MLLKCCLKPFFFMVFVIFLNDVISQNEWSLNPEIEKIKMDVEVLACDSFTGRETGTLGEYYARKYIEKRFKRIGLQPLFDTSYYQPFTVRSGSYIDINNYMKVNNRSLQLFIDYYPLGYSASSFVEAPVVFCKHGVFCPEQGINDFNGVNLDGNIALINLSVPEEYINNKTVWDSSQKIIRIKQAITRGAKAVIFYVSNPDYGKPLKDIYYYMNEELKIPVVFIENNAFIDTSGQVVAEIKVSINKTKNRTAYNVGGIINNNAQSTIVVGAHYDHVGMGFYSSRDQKTYDIHNGADDNASGTAAVLALAEMIKMSDLKKYNFIFLAFSAEELGLLGSDYFVENFSGSQKLNCMVNLDMIGRLNEKRELKIFGTGTAKEWKSLINNTERNVLQIKKYQSGIGGSDHTSFNLKGIPAVFLHTGLHKDYHRATDDTGLINFIGMKNVIDFTYDLIRNINNSSLLTFKTAGILDSMINK